jgi:hypothetical protein
MSSPSQNAWRPTARTLRARRSAPFEERHGSPSAACASARRRAEPEAFPGDPPYPSTFPGGPPREAISAEKLSPASLATLF